MKAKLITIANTHKHWAALARARRILRIRYGVIIAINREERDPVWLSAHGM